MLLAALIASTGSAASDEPPTQLRVELDGRQYVTTAGAPLDVEVGGTKAKLRIDELPWRHFTQGSLQFDYPRHFPWESDPSSWGRWGRIASPRSPLCRRRSSPFWVIGVAAARRENAPDGTDVFSAAAGESAVAIVSGRIAVRVSS